jgi:predicted transglutaminase-like cysteine proteinase
MKQLGCKEDYWATPYQFLKKNGDCEDYAICQDHGPQRRWAYPSRTCASWRCRTSTSVSAMPCSIVYNGTDALLLDNQIKTVVPANTIKHYQPVYSINENGWWLHRR